MLYFLNAALFIHITLGLTALLAGLMAIISKKGQKSHRVTGLIFFYSMLGVAVSAIFISIIKVNWFLLHAGVFAFYQNYNGYRSIKNKSLKPSYLDWLVLFIAIVNSFAMLYSLNIILMVYGAISTFLVIIDFRIFILTARNKEIPSKQWLIRHLGMMLGTYISTFTAFLVVNVEEVAFVPDWLPWLMPTFIGVPLIFYWIRKYSLKEKSRQSL